MFSFLRRALRWLTVATPTDDTRELFPQYEIGIETYGNPKVFSWGADNTLKLGSYCSIGGDVQILLGGNHRVDWVSTFPFPARWPEAADIPGHPASKGDVIIGHDVWIGRQTVILSGVSIGTGAVIGCNSVVGSDVPPYTITAGNPARSIRQRFSDDIVKRLLASRWWERNREELVPLLPLICDTNIDAFLNAVENG